MTHRISAGVIVEHDQRILLVHRLVSLRDCWAAPGGDAKGTEPLRETARRQAFEETGLEIEVRELMYIEEFHDADVRTCKFWFAGWLLGGTLSVASPEARGQGIVEAGWFNAAEIVNRTVFPHVLAGPYWTDRMQKPRIPIHLATVRRAEF